MTSSSLEVLIDGVPMGKITMQSGTLAFEYHDNYLARVTPTPLSLSIPTTNKHHPNRAILPFLWGLLPDNHNALEQLALDHQVSTKSPYALLSHVGRDVAGALEILRPGEKSEDAFADRSSYSQISKGEVVAELHRSIRAYRGGRESGDRQYRTSLAGAQPKIALSKISDDIWGRPTAGVPTTHILKPELIQSNAPEDSPYPDLVVVEHFSLAMASAAGLDTAKSTLWYPDNSNLRVLVLPRYDRHVLPNQSIARLHQEDFCQALTVLPEKKYQHRDGGPGVGSIATLIKTRILLSDRHDVATAFLRALTYNVAIVNTDAHAKNYSLMLEGSHVRMAPLYDASSMARYVSSRRESLSYPMSIDGEYKIGRIGVTGLAKEGSRLGIPKNEAESIIMDVLKNLPSAFESAREQVRDIPGAVEMADVMRANLREISPLHNQSGIGLSD